MDAFHARHRLFRLLLRGHAVRPDCLRVWISVGSFLSHTCPACRTRLPSYVIHPPLHHRIQNGVQEYRWLGQHIWNIFPWYRWLGYLVSVIAGIIMGIMTMSHFANPPAAGPDRFANLTETATKHANGKINIASDLLFSEGSLASEIRAARLLGTFPTKLRDNLLLSKGDLQGGVNSALNHTRHLSNPYESFTEAAASSFSQRTQELEAERLGFPEPSEREQRYRELTLVPWILNGILYFPDRKGRSLEETSNTVVCGLLSSINSQQVPLIDSASTMLNLTHEVELLAANIEYSHRTAVSEANWRTLWEQDKKRQPLGVAERLGHAGKNLKRNARSELTRIVAMNIWIRRQMHHYQCSEVRRSR